LENIERIIILKEIKLISLTKKEPKKDISINNLLVPHFLILNISGNNLDKHLKQGVYEFEIS